MDFLPRLDHSEPRDTRASSPLSSRQRGQAARPKLSGLVPLTGRRVLVVEDDDALRRMLEQRFSSEGCVVRSASEGQEALRLLDADTPDLIVLDLMLPWINGIEVLGRVRQQPRLVNVPVLVTTGTATTPFDLRQTHSDSNALLQTESDRSSLAWM
jgi:CheY-like chemotaxis protein